MNGKINVISQTSQYHSGTYNKDNKVSERKQEDLQGEEIPNCRQRLSLNLEITTHTNES